MYSYTFKLIYRADVCDQKKMETGVLCRYISAADDIEAMQMWRESKALKEIPDDCHVSLTITKSKMPEYSQG